MSGLHTQADQPSDASKADLWAAPWLVPGLELGFAAVWLGLVVIARSSPGWEPVLFLFLGLSFAAAGAFVVVRGVILLERRRRGIIRHPRLEVMGLLALPVAAVLAVLSTWSTLPVRVRLELSDSALEAYAEDFRQSGETWNIEGRRVGLYWIDSTRTEGNCVLMETGWAFFTQMGLAHCEGDPPEDPLLRWDHVTGPWWVWAWGSEGID